jgi:hypothetical protein
MTRILKIAWGYVVFAALYGVALSLLVTVIINIVRFNELRLDHFFVVFPAVSFVMLVLMVVSTARMKWVSAYRNEPWQFRMQFPSGWTARGSDAERNPNPTFDGPSSQIKFAIGPMTRVTSAADQRQSLERVAIQNGHECVETGLMTIGDREHATMVCRVPMTGLLKNYSLVFGRTEFLVTARGNFDDIDAIMNTFEREP